MKFIPTAIHAAIDYFFGFLLIAISWLPVDGFTTTDTVLLNVAGIFVIFYSMLTKYELGFVCIIPMRIHLMLDIIAGLALVAVPWIFDIYDDRKWFYIVPGVFSVIAGFVSKTGPGRNFEQL